MRLQLNLRRSFRPLLESLETRALLSICMVDRLTDVGEGKDFVGDLRYCLEQAQDKDSIQFAVKGTINLTRALPDLTRSVSIEGPGADLLTVEIAVVQLSGVFTVSPGTTSSLSGITVRQRSFSPPFGGGINNGGTLTVTSSIIEGFAAYGGGGIVNRGFLAITSSVISGSSVSLSQFDPGGGGIYNAGHVSISHTSVRGTAGNKGGGISNDGIMTLDYSTVAGGSVYGPGFGRGGGAGIYNSGSLTVSNSTVSQNVIGLDDDRIEGLGGGILNDGTLTVRNSTIANNTANNVIGRGAGGGIYNDGTLQVLGSTIAGNEASPGGGGGIFNADSRTLHMRNSILAGNRSFINGPDLDGRLTSSGYNLIGTTQGGGGFDKTDLLNVNPRLGPLQNNGGPTLTHALLPGSPALDAGDPTDAPEWDQRGEGYYRIVGKNIDIGAYEEQGGEGPSPGSDGFDVAALLTLQLSQDRRWRS